MKISPFAAAALTILSIATPVSPAATTSGSKSIVGGTNANATEFPFFVQGQGCGASLIWYDIALSAANCYNWAFNHEVYIGSYIRNTVTNGVIVQNVTKQVMHPAYDQFRKNDVLVLKLNKEVPRTGTRIKLIELNNITSNPADNDPLTIVGFGRTNLTLGPWSANLQKATLYTSSQTMCYDSERSYDHTTMICASGAGNTNGCFGDSGGPVIDARGVQVGVSSWVPMTCQASNYFSRVSAAYQWIRAQICMLASNPPAYCPTVRLTNSTSWVVYSTTLTFTSEGLLP